MPDEDGYGLTKKIIAWEISQGLPPIRAIALTVYARDEDSHWAISNGFQRHLSKPIEPHKLALAISQLAGKIATQELRRDLG